MTAPRRYSPRAIAEAILSGEFTQSDTFVCAGDYDALAARHAEHFAAWRADSDASLQQITTLQQQLAAALVLQDANQH